jgi:hypothetical protein
MVDYGKMFQQLNSYLDESDIYAGMIKEMPKPLDKKTTLPILGKLTTITRLSIQVLGDIHKEIPGNIQQNLISIRSLLDQIHTAVVNLVAQNALDPK